MLVDQESLKTIIAKAKTLGKKIVMTNGCFDILHCGHLHYLEKSKNLGDILVIAINSDASVKKLKGPDRPINNQTDRARLVAALKPVDYVVIFDEMEASKLIQMIIPDFYTKGQDYQINSLKEYPIAKALGCEIILIDFVEGKSSTKLMHAIDQISS